jgi:hypothetical protein
LSSFTTKYVTMVSLHNYYLSTILELKCSTHLQLIVNYVATHTIERYTNCVIPWKCECKPSVGLEWWLKCLWVCTLQTFID